MSFSEQSGTPLPNQNLLQPDPSAEIHPCGESSQKSSALTEEMDGETPSEEDSESDLDSESCSDSDSWSESDSGLVVPSEEFPVLPSKETSSENLKDQANLEKTSPQGPDLNSPLQYHQIPEIKVKVKSKKNSSYGTNEQKTDISTKKRSTSEKQSNKKGKRLLRALRNFSQKEFHSIWFGLNLFLLAFDRTSLKTNQTCIASILTWAADLIVHEKDEDYFSKSLAIYTRECTLDTNYNPGPIPAEFDDYLYRLSDEVWPRAIQLIEKDLLSDCDYDGWY